jgi:hypothetical protein
VVAVPTAAREGAVVAVRLQGREVAALAWRSGREAAALAWRSGR